MNDQRRHEAACDFADRIMKKLGYNSYSEFTGEFLVPKGEAWNRWLKHYDAWFRITK